jgi:hypothetical protein
LSHTLALPPWIGICFALAICAAAAWRGGRAERGAAAAFIAAWFAAYVTKDHSWLGLQWRIFIIDVAFFVALAAIALRSRWYWPIFAAGFQLLSVVTHAASTVDHQLGAWAYMTANVIWTYLFLVALAVGVAGAWKRRDQVDRAEATDTTRR